jgi:ribosomal protein S18 acetylase RimI-like enzyme
MTLKRHRAKLLYLGRTRDPRLPGLIKRWLYSDDVGVGVARELDTPIPTRNPRIPLTLRPMRPEDEHWFTDHEGHSESQAINRLDARRILDSGISTFYVAVTEDDEPVFMQLLAFPPENDHLRSAWGGMVPPLQPDEAIIDFAFTLEKYRAVGAMPWALARLAEIAREGGAKRLVAWLPEDNVSMNRFFRRVGFTRVGTRHERYRFGRRRISFEPYEDPEPESAPRAQPGAAATGDGEPVA